MELADLRLLHDRMFCHLDSKGVYFKPRIKNYSNRLTEGYWFLGTQDYLCINFWNGYDHDRKVPNIHLQIYPEDLSFVRLVLTSRRDLTKISVFRDIGSELNIEESSSLNEWEKLYLNESNDIDGVFNIVDEFLKNDKIIIDKIVDFSNHEKLNRINVEHFESWKGRIWKCREVLNYNIDENHFNKPTIVQYRKGVDFVEDSDYFYKQVQKIRSVSRKHKKVQNSLKSVFDNLDEVYEVRLEENNIDLVLEYSDSILIMELKTDESPRRCIRHGIGQILEYYFKNFKNWSKPVTLCISGPNELSENDKIYFKFLQKSFDFDLSYYSYDLNKFYN